VTPPLGLTRGDVVLTPFPFTDLRGSAVRPALVVSQGLIGQDVILAGISSVVRGAISSADHLVDVAHSEFRLTGLRVVSVVRLHKLAAVDASILVRRLGRIGPLIQTEVDRLLRTVLGL
jgi:mRNA interferase MazF